MGLRISFIVFKKSLACVHIRSSVTCVFSPESELWGGGKRGGSLCCCPPSSGSSNRAKTDRVCVFGCVCVCVCVSTK